MRPTFLTAALPLAAALLPDPAGPGAELVGHATPYSKRQTVKNILGPFGGEPNFDARLKGVIVDMINMARSFHEDTPDVAWNDELAKGARDVANTCVYGHDQETQDKKWGQNIAYQTMMPDKNDATKPDYAKHLQMSFSGWWDQERFFFNTASKDWKSEKDLRVGPAAEEKYKTALKEIYKIEYEIKVQTGHYTQIVWRNTTEVGCAMSLCGNEVYTVCNFRTGGNTYIAYDEENKIPSEEAFRGNVKAVKNTDDWWGYLDQKEVWYNLYKDRLGAKPFDSKAKAGMKAPKAEGGDVDAGERKNGNKDGAKPLKLQAEPPQLEELRMPQSDQPEARPAQPELEAPRPPTTRPLACPRRRRFRERRA